MCENASNLIHPTMGSATGRSDMPPAPRPRIGLSIRVGVATDFAFIDALQKKHRDEVGFMPRVQLVQYINGGHVLMAESSSPLPPGEGAGVRASASDSRPPDSGRVVQGSPHPALSQGERVPEKAPLGTTPLGYIIARDRYFKHDDVGIIYQLNVAPGSQRKLVGAALVQEVFNRAAYGCKLFCCWCAQDIAANRFWEAMGFKPLAFRTGSEEKDRIHIFWQKRIQQGDQATPYWYPSQTNAGALREDRLALPIPAGVKWSDAMPRIVPSSGGESAEGELFADAEEGPRKLPLPCNPTPEEAGRSRTLTVVDAGGPVTKKRKPAEVRKISSGGMWTPPVRKPVEAKANEEAAAVVPAGVVAKKKGGGGKPERRRFEARHVAMARELRDRFLEQVNAGAIELPAPPGGPKYDVCRRNELTADAGFRCASLPDTVRMHGPLLLNAA
jgi:GNAT superfamily N-acetyltransferase